MLAIAGGDRVWAVVVGRQAMRCVKGRGFYTHWQIGISPRESNDRVVGVEWAL